MDFLRTFWMVALGAFLSSCLLLYECRQLDGYRFPVWTTTFCPRNKTEWDVRSSSFNCNSTSSYACLPNENFTELLEFCYPLQVISIQKGLCLYLPKDDSKVDAYDCNNFQKGCPTENYRGSTIYEHPSCVSLGRGCFLQEPSCKSVTETPFQGTSSDELSTNSSVWVMIFAPLLTIIFISVVATLLFLFFRRRKLQSRENNDEENSWGIEQQAFLGPNADPNSEEIPIYMKNNPDTASSTSKLGAATEPSEQEVTVTETNVEEIPAGTEQHPLLMDKKDKAPYKETDYEISIFDQWTQDNACFYSTKAAKKVANTIKHNNLVVVTGHSGSGKSAIIQDIALKYRKQGWVVKPVYTFEEIHSAYKSESFQKGRSLFVFNDPIGKESFDEVLFGQWTRYRETINLMIKEIKLMLTCRKSIISDRKAKQFLKEALEIEIDNSQYALSSEEKKAIFKRHMPDEKLTEKEFAQISKSGIYFPLLCKLCKAESKQTKNKLHFFTNPVNVLETELESYKENHKEKYCGLVCLVFNNNEVCLDDLQRNPELLSTVFSVSGLPLNTSPNTIIKNLEYLQGFLVKRIGEKFTFYHDFVMEVTTYVFGSEHHEHTIKFADLSFLRKRISLEKTHKKADDPFTIYLSDYHVSSLVNRLFEELFGDRFIEVVLNPCLRNKQVIVGMEVMLNRLDEQKMLQLINLQKTNTAKLELKRGKEDFSFSTLEFICAETGLSPLFALIAFGHDELSKLCLTRLKKTNAGFNKSGLFPAICANGNEDLIRMFSKKEINECLQDAWDNMYPIHIVSVFHNYKILDIVAETGTNVNMFTKDTLPWTPLMLASRIHTKQILKTNTVSKSTESDRRNKTVEILIDRGANVNVCDTEGYSPLYIACQNGHEGTAKLLLNNGADVNLLEKNGASLLYTACYNGHEGTAQLLLNNGADVNLCNNNGVSPLYVACCYVHEGTAQLLLNNGADVNLCTNNGVSPLYTACQSGHDGTVQLLLNNGADVNLLEKNGISPLNIACYNGHEGTAQLLLNNGADVNLCNNNGVSPLYAACYNGHEATARLLLNNGADVNLCNNDGMSPLFIACQNGHEGTAQLLLNNDAELNLCTNNGENALCTSCENGHEGIAQLLLNNSAEVNLCTNNGVSPLYNACQSGHEGTAQLLLNNDADVNLCDNDGLSPLYSACYNGHEATARLLLNNGADVNLCDNDGESPLWIACQEGHEGNAQFLLNNGADVNLCNNDGVSPLNVACYSGHECTAKLLLDNGANVNLCDEDRTSPLWIACKNGHEGTAQLLLNNDADVNLCDENRVSPLGIACQNGHEGTAQLLVDNGANLNSYDKNGSSPLWIACQKGHKNIARCLLRNGANVNLCNNIGNNPLWISRLNGNESIEQLLLSYGAELKNDFSKINA